MSAEKSDGGTVFTIVDNGKPPGGAPCQRVEFRGRDLPLEFLLPLTDFADRLQENEGTLKRIFAPASRAMAAGPLDIPFVFHDPRPATPPPGALAVYTDGSASPSGAAGWAGIIVYGPHRVVEVSGRESPATSNRAELLAVVRTLERADSPGPLAVRTDSRYVVRGAQAWIANWESNGYVTALNRPAKNRDLWESLSALMKEREIFFTWIASSSPDPHHRRCDALSREMALRGVEYSVGTHGGPRT